MNSTFFDLIIIGGGAAGLAAGVFAGRNSIRTAIIEKMPSPGKKLLTTGGGHCNITNNATKEKFYEVFGKNGRFIAPAMEEFDNHSMKKFFSSLLVELHSPDSFHIFPKSGKASDIVNALLNEAQRTNVVIFTSTKALEILFQENSVSGIKTEKGIFQTRKVILACGGMSYPETGSDGSGYALAKIAGHSIVKPVPALVELYCDKGFSSNLSGLSLKNVEISAPELKIRPQQGEFLFTHRGISGPVVLNISGEVAAKLTEGKQVKLKINLLPELNKNQIITKFEEWRKHSGKKKTSNCLASLIPHSLAENLIIISRCNDTEISQLSSQEQQKLISNLTEMTFNVFDTAGFAKAMLTKGGVSLKEVNPHTLESRIRKGLFFCRRDS